MLTEIHPVKLQLAADTISVKAYFSAMSNGPLNVLRSKRSLRRPKQRLDERDWQSVEFHDLASIRPNIGLLYEGMLSVDMRPFGKIRNA